jgi:PEP-CTERM motif
MFDTRKIKNALFAKSCSVSLMVAALVSSGQGTIIYDQQSADENSGGGGFLKIQSYQPIGQSFTPANSSIGFVRLWLADLSLNGLGAMANVNLRSDSITGSVIASSDSVFIPDGFGLSSRGFVDFFFPTPVTVVPGSTYYFQPVVQSGDSALGVGEYHYLYLGGTAFFNGTANSTDDLWFREGIVVPEPSSLSLLIGGGVLFYVGRKKIKMRSRT